MAKFSSQNKVRHKQICEFQGLFKTGTKIQDLFKIVRTMTPLLKLSKWIAALKDLLLITSIDGKKVADVSDWSTQPVVIETSACMYINFIHLYK